MKLQERIWNWACSVFGLTSIVNSPRTRAYRFLEEANELAQACNISKEDAHRLVDYTWGRPKGALQEEIGGVMLTLAVLCHMHGRDMEECAETTLHGAYLRGDQIRAKDTLKPVPTP